MSDILNRPLTATEQALADATTAHIHNQTRDAHPDLAAVVPADDLDVHFATRPGHASVNTSTDDVVEVIEVDRGNIVLTQQHHDWVEVTAAIMLILCLAGAIFGAVIQALQP